MVTPAMQLELRAGQRKNMKRGRKPGKGKGKGGKGKKGKEPKNGKKAPTKTMKRKASKRNILKRNARKAKPVEMEPEEAAQTSSNKRKRVSKQEPEPQIHQERVQISSKVWRYEVLPQQVFGCGNCRFIFGGCKVCKNPSFRGKTAAKLRTELEGKTGIPAKDVGQADGSEREEAPAAQGPKRRRSRRSM